MDVIDQKVTDKYAIYNGDCVEVTSNLKDDSVGFSIFSPPFSSLYTFSNSERDMSNHKTNEEFMEHFGFLVEELYKKMKPGRIVAVHCTDLAATKNTHGHIGLMDFSGDIIRLFQKFGFIYHSKVVIWKDPAVQMQRTKATGLLHKRLTEDSSISRQGMPDYLVMFRKPGENEEPIEGEIKYYTGGEENELFIEHERDDGSVAKVMDHPAASVRIWQRYASPVWWDIQQGNTLQFRNARENDDERHISALQLDVIERAMQLWSKEGDIVYSPFAGIGSELYVALKMGRKAIGAELKGSYYNMAIKNLDDASIAQYDLFD